MRWQFNCQEQFQVEFVDAMPGGFDTWWDSREIQDAFLESARWRTTAVFSQRTLDLFNYLDSERERISLLIELSASISHPVECRVNSPQSTSKKNGRPGCVLVS